MSDRHPDLRRKTLSKMKLAATALVSSVAAFLVLELFARLFLPDPLRFLEDGREMLLRPSADADLRYELTPGASGRAWNTDVKINSGGFRGPEAAVGKSPKFRIITLGDSVTFGNDLPPETTFPYQLQNVLEAGSGPGYEVLNLAVGGYNAIQEVAFLEKRGLAYRPDLVAVGYCLNDLAVASVNLAYLETIQVLRRGGVYRSLLVRYLVHRFATRNLEEWQARQNELPVFTHVNRGRIDPIGRDETTLRELMKRVSPALPSGWYADEPRVGLLRHAFGRLKAMSLREGFRVVIVIIPWLDWTPDGYAHHPAHQIVTYEARRAGFDVLDMEGPFRRHDVKSLNLPEIPGDTIHPNREGHRIIAEALREYIRSISSRGEGQGEGGT